jgi:hypothetical protein
MADYDFNRVDARIENNHYEAAWEIIEADKKKIYAAQDTVLYNLDLGALSHYAGNWERSNAELTQAEIDIFNNFSVSISESITAWLANDTALTYQGETYEDIYTNIFMALNYLQMGNNEDAFVEIRRFDNKLREITSKYQVKIAEMQKSAAAGTANVDSKMEFHNSALARYLSLLLYRAEGRLDEADVDRRLIQSAFLTQPRLYPFPQPQSIAHEIDVPKGQARLNIAAFSGRAPVKEEIVTRFWAPDGSFYYKLALPEMKKQPSRVQAVECLAFDAAGRVAAREKLETLEDISAIAVDTFKQRRALIYFRSAARSIAKSVSGAAAGAVARENDSLAAGLVSIFLMVASEATERADVRTSKFFPGKAWVTGVNLAPGEYTIHVEFLGAGRRVLFTQEFKNVIIQEGKLNFVEALCLR